MKSIIILCEVTERAQLIDWFKDCSIKTNPCRIETPLFSRVALRVFHNSLSEIADSGIKFGEKHDKILFARVKAEEAIKAYEITRQNITNLMATNNEERFYLFFDQKEPNRSEITSSIESETPKI